jgi:hypothetical protein
MFMPMLQMFGGGWILWGCVLRMPQRILSKHLMEQQYKDPQLKLKLPSTRLVVVAKSIDRGNLEFRIPQMLSSGLAESSEY